MKRDRAMKGVMKAAGLLPTIKPSPTTERSKRARARVLDKLRGGKGIHSTQFSVLERTELPGMERDHLVGYHQGLSKWFDAAGLQRQLEAGAAEANRKTAAAAAAVGEIRGTLQRIAASGAAFVVPAVAEPVLVCCWCGVVLPKVGPHSVCGTCLHRELLELGSEGAPV